MHVNSKPAFGQFKKKPASAPPSTPLRFASVQNRVYESAGGIGGCNRYYFRGKQVLGANMYSLRLGTQNWHLQSNGETNTGNAITYEGVCIEVPNGAIVPITWDGGSVTKTLANGDNHVLSDSILASAFGTTLDRGDEIWIKGIISVPAGGDKVPVGGFLVAEVSGAQSGFYASANTTPSNIYAGGIFTFTGTAPFTSANIHMPILLGQPFVDGVQYFGIGDSILYGAFDDTSQGAFGRGFFQRAMHNSFSDPVPSCNFGRSSASLGSITGVNTKWRSWIQYANRAVEQILTNNISTTSVASMQSNIAALWTTLKSNGIQKIIRTQLMAKTTSTDNWATTGNQTPATADWDTGGKVDQMNAWFSTQVGTTIEAFASMSAVLDTDPNLWKTNGVANRMTNDGTHLLDNGTNAVGNATAASPLRSARITLG